MSTRTVPEESAAVRNDSRGFADGGAVCAFEAGGGTGDLRMNL